MTPEDIKSFTRRVSEANSCELIVILYDVILTDIKTAREALTAGNKEQYIQDIHHAQRFVNELISCLDFSVELSYNLMSLYAYFNRQFSYAAAGYHVEAMDIIEESVLKLRSSFDKISAEDKGGALMQNTQQVYAGLTYGKGTLNETFVDPRDYNRGFKA